MQKELEDAVSMFKRSTIAMDQLCPNLEFVVLQTGAKMYGCHLLENHPTDYIHVPLSEDQPRLKPPYHDMLFYHPQLDWISDYAAHKKWSWCDTRPDIIIGFVPNQNFYSLATGKGPSRWVDIVCKAKADLTRLFLISLGHIPGFVCCCGR